MRHIACPGWRRFLATLTRVLAIAALAVPAQADPLLLSERPHDQEARQALHRAQHEVDYAWEVFHKAALGGTLASPAIQADAEEALHESRGLLVKARTAADLGDRSVLPPLLNRIHELTARAIADSQELKR